MHIDIMIWGIVVIATVVAEALTLQLVTIWFAVGACVALLLAWVGCPVLGQLLAFTLVSVLLFCATRPLLKKIQAKNTLPTNMEAEAGKFAVVIQDINNTGSTGRVRIGGVNWRARAEDNRIYKTGETVQVERISGTTAYIVALQEKTVERQKL